MEFMLSRLTRQESDECARRLQTHIGKHGYGLWAVSVQGGSDFIGFTGLQWIEGFPFSPAVEIGWRLAFPYWGKGYATEAARAALQDGFERVGLKEVISIAAVGNVRSRRVMEKLGMKRDPKGDFDHPRVPRGDPAVRCVLYKIYSS